MARLVSAARCRRRAAPASLLEQASALGAWHRPVVAGARLQRGSRSLARIMGGRTEPILGLGRCLGVLVSSGPLFSTHHGFCDAVVLQHTRARPRGHRGDNE